MMSAIRSNITHITGIPLKDAELSLWTENEEDITHK